MLSLQWKKKTLKNGVVQFVNYDEDSETELMMLPTDLALTQDPSFRKWVELYARDKDRFFEDFAKVFAKLVELGIERDGEGRITNVDNERGGYHSAPKKKQTPGNPGNPEKTTDDKHGPSESTPLKNENEQFKARL
jgi:cytochrome c peroxidase